MTKKDILRALKENRRAGRWPGSLNQIAERLGVHRSNMTHGLHRPRRAPKARRDIEAAIRGEMTALRDSPAADGPERAA